MPKVPHDTYSTNTQTTLLMSTYWSPKNEAHYKQYIEDVESSNDLKAKGAMKVVTAELIGETSDLRVHGHCPQQVFTLSFDLKVIYGEFIHRAGY